MVNSSLQPLDVAVSADAGESIPSVPDQSQLLQYTASATNLRRASQRPQHPPTPFPKDPLLMSGRSLHAFRCAVQFVPRQLRSTDFRWRELESKGVVELSENVMSKILAKCFGGHYLPRNRTCQ